MRYSNIMLSPLQVNEMKDSATQIEEEVDKTKTELHRHKMEMNKLKDKLSRMDKNDPHYVSYIIGFIHFQNIVIWNVFVV